MITLTSGLPALQESMTIQAPSSNYVIINGNGNRAFTVVAGRVVTLTNLTIQNTSDQNGPAITNNGGTVLVQGGYIQSNSATKLGGAIYNDTAGSISIQNATINSNSSTGNGGAIYSANGNVTLNNNLVTVNSATSGGSGGAVYVAAGTFASTHNAYCCNTAALDGGAIVVGSGTMNSIDNDTFVSNTSHQNGGAISIGSGTGNVSGGTLMGNVAGSTGGGLYVSGLGIANISATSFYSNVAAGGGGIASSNALTASNSLFFYNSITTSVGGGGLNILGGSAVLINNTITRNRSPLGPDGGGVLNTIGTTILTNTIVSDNVGLNCASPSGTFIVSGNNLRWPSTDSSCSGMTLGDPKLGPLVRSSGFVHFTFYVGLLSGSAAINAGNNSACAAPPVNNLDQRGVTRPIGIACNIGAIEGTTYPVYLPLIDK